jgi:hypothetical protein
LDSQRQKAGHDEVLKNFEHLRSANLRRGVYKQKKVARRWYICPKPEKRTMLSMSCYFRLSEAESRTWSGVFGVLIFEKFKSELRYLSRHEPESASGSGVGF